MDNDLTGWFAVRTMYRNDLNVGRYLEAQGAEVFIPMHYVDVKRGGAVRQVLEPVVRNIVFTRTCRSLLDRVKKELESKWAIRLFMNRETHEPILIPEEQMRSFIAVAGELRRAAALSGDRRGELQGRGSDPCHRRPFPGCAGTAAPGKGPQAAGRGDRGCHGRGHDLPAAPDARADRIAAFCALSSCRLARPPIVIRSVKWIGGGKQAAFCVAATTERPSLF